jgi:hypothetical protein
MTIEYVLLLIVVFSVGVKSFIAAPKKAFLESGPRLGARVEQHIVTGRGFSLNHEVKWIAKE